jgi:hypothetical protein
VAWNSQSFLVAWTGADSNGGMTVGARIGADGTRLDADGFAIDPLLPNAPRGQAAFPTAVGLASDGTGHWLAVTDRFDPAPGVETVRVNTRLFTDCTVSTCPAPPDGGVSPVDARPADGQPGDGGVRDAFVDGATTDTGTGDTGADGAVPQDVAPDVDSAATDAADGSATTETQSNHADAQIDLAIDEAGQGDASGPRQNAGGCGCSLTASHSGRDASAWVLLMAGVGIGAIRSRRRTPPAPP